MVNIMQCYISRHMLCLILRLKNVHISCQLRLQTENVSEVAKQFQAKLHVSAERVCGRRLLFKWKRRREKIC